MEEAKGKTEGYGTSEDGGYSRAVRAGKRTYFFDVKSARKNEYFLSITESKKRYNKDGRFYYEKHKIFLQMEDFEKFLEVLNESMQYIRENSTNEVYEEAIEPSANEASYTDVEFEDLDKVEVTASADEDERE